VLYQIVCYISLGLKISTDPRMLNNFDRS